MIVLRNEFQVRVLVDTPKWWIRPRNTDWRYTKSLREMEAFAPIRITMLDSYVDVVESVVRFGLGKLGYPADTKGKPRWQGGDADVVFSHRAFPRGSPIPVVWMHALLDPVMLEANGMPQQEISNLLYAAADGFAGAAVSQVCTELGRERHAKAFGLPMDRLSSCPFFLPHLATLPMQAVEQKHQGEDRVRLLFVGHQARRKGLDLLLQALGRLPVALARRIHFDVVSDLTDIRRGDLSVPDGVDVRLHGRLPRHKTLALFEAAHIYAMPSRLESYGLSFVEAAAAGCAVIAPHWESQRDIFDSGKTGWLVDPFSDFAVVLEEAIVEREQRLMFALRARNKADESFVPSVVVVQHIEMFAAAMRQKL